MRLLIHPRGEEIPRYFTEVLEDPLSQLSVASERAKKKKRTLTLRTASIFFFFFWNSLDGAGRGTIRSLLMSNRCVKRESQE